jgi:hypothetical protein
MADQMFMPTFHLGSHVVHTAGKSAAARACVATRNLLVADDRAIRLLNANHDHYTVYMRLQIISC